MNLTGEPRFHFIEVFVEGLGIDRVMGLAINRVVSMGIDIAVDFFGLSLW